MRLFQCAILCFFLSISARAQFVAKLPLPQAAAIDSVPDPTIEKVNALIEAFNKEKTVPNLQKLRAFLKANTNDTTNAFSVAGDSLLRRTYAIADSTVSKLDITPFAVTKLAVASGKKTPCEQLYRIADLKIEKNEDAEYVVSFVDSSDNPVSQFVLKQFNPQLYKDKVMKSLYGLCNNIASKADTGVIESLFAEMDKQDLYTRMLEASLEVKDDDVPAGVLTINKNPKLNIWIKKGTKEYKESEEFKTPAKVDTADAKFHLRRLNNFTVHHIEIQFQDGFIENIIVLGKWGGDSRMLKFENGFPIPFSTRRDFRMLQHYYLYERTVYSDGQRIYKDIYKGPLSIRLGDLVFFSQNLAINTKDYSPYNQVYKADIVDSTTTLNLYKEKTSKILELKIYSDLKGIEGEQPNGLVQFELSKKLNLYTKRFPIPKWGNWFNIGFLNYVTPYFTMSKIENNNKRLVPSYYGSQEKDTSKPNVFASTLDLLQHQVFSLGVNFNLLTIDIPGIKSTISANAGLYFGRTLIQDTLRNSVDSLHFKSKDGNNVFEYGVNNFQFVPEISWQIFPDKRYGVTVTQRWDHFKVHTDKLTQVVDSSQFTGYLQSLNGDRSKIDDYKPKYWLSTTEIFAFYRPSEFNQVFFRYRYNWDPNSTSHNFYQLQLGISTYLTHTKKDKKERVEN